MKTYISGLVATCGIMGSMFIVGCGSEPYSKKEVVKPTGPLPVVTTVKNIAETGQLGSASMEIESAIESLKKTDEAKASILEQGLKDMKAAEQDPDQLKRVAADLATKL